MGNIDEFLGTLDSQQSRAALPRLCKGFEGTLSNVWERIWRRCFEMSSKLKVSPLLLSVSGWNLVDAQFHIHELSFKKNNLILLAVF